MYRTPEYPASELSVRVCVMQFSFCWRQNSRVHVFQPHWEYSLAIGLGTTPTRENMPSPLRRKVAAANAYVSRNVQLPFRHNAARAQARRM